MDMEIRLDAGKLIRILDAKVQETLEPLFAELDGTLQRIATRHTVSIEGIEGKVE